MRGLIGLGIKVYRLLPRKLRAAAILNLFGMVVQSVFEIIAVTAIIPVVYLIAPDSAGVAESKTFAPLLAWLDTMPWFELSGVVILIYLIKNLTSLWLSHSQSLLVKKVAVHFTGEIYSRFFRQSWTSYLQTNSSESARRILNTPAEFSNFVLQGYLLVLTDLFIVLFMFAGLALLDYRLVLLVAGLACLLILFFLFFRGRLFSRADQSFRTLTSESGISLGKGIDSFAETRIYNKEKHFLLQFERLRESTASYLAQLKTMSGIPPRMFEMVGILCLVSGIAYTRWDHAASGGSVVLVGLISVAVYRIMPSLNRMLINLLQVQAYRYTVAELEESFAEEPHKALRQKTTIAFEKEIHLEKVSFQYPDAAAPVFEPFSLTIRKGELLVITGKSGCGKTTLIHILTGLLQQKTGQVLIDGVLLQEENLSSWQEKIGLVPQSPVVLQDSIQNNVAFGEHVIDETKLRRALDLSVLGDFLKEDERTPETLVGENGLTLSGGQRQRLALARALYRDPQLLLLDEVTNQLDEKVKIQLLENLRSLTHTGKTVVIVSHDPVVSQYATVIYQVEKA